MKKLHWFLWLWPLVTLADPPQAVTVDFDGGKAPALQVYQANYKTFLWSVKNGINAVNLTGYSPLMYWTTSNSALTVVTASCSVVSATAGTFTATFVPAQLNYAASNWIYGVGLSSGSVTVARQGTFTILADAYAMGGMTNAVSWVTNLNCDLINFINPPWNNITNSSYTKAETDAKYATNTPLYAETDPLWNASSGGVWVAINGKQASGTYATNTAINAVTATDIANWNAAGTAVDTNALIAGIAANAGYTNRAALALASNVYDSFVAAMLATNNAQSALITLLQGYTNRAAVALASNVYDSFVAAMLATNNAQTALILAETSARIAHDGTNAANILAVGAGATNAALAIGLGATNLVAVETAARIAHDSTNAANILAVGAGSTNLVNASGAGATNYANAVGNAVGEGATNLYTVEAASRAAHDSTNAANILAVGAGATNIAKAIGAGATNIAAAVGAGATNLYTIEAAARLAWDTTNAASASAANTNANGRTPIGTHAASTAAIWSAISTITSSNTSLSDGTNIQVVSISGSEYAIHLRVNANVPIGPIDSANSAALIWQANGSGIHTTRWGSAGFLIDGNTAFHSGNLNTNSFAPIASWTAFTAAYYTAAAAQVSTNAGFQTALDSKMSITGLVPTLTVANLSSVGTNLTALTAAYTGTLGGVIVYTGAVEWVAGKTYSVGIGLSATYLGTSWLSIAEYRLTNSAVGTSVSNYFSASTSTGTMTLSIASVAGMAQIVTNLFVREVTTGNLSVAGTLNVGGASRFGEAITLDKYAGDYSTVSSDGIFVTDDDDSGKIGFYGDNANLRKAGLYLSDTKKIDVDALSLYGDWTIVGNVTASNLFSVSVFNASTQKMWGAVNTNAALIAAMNTASTGTIAQAQTTGDVAHVRALQAQGLASNAMPKSGGTFTGAVTNNVGWYGNGAGLTNLSLSGGTGDFSSVIFSGGTTSQYLSGDGSIQDWPSGSAYDHSHATNAFAPTKYAGTNLIIDRSMGPRIKFTATNNSQIGFTADWGTNFEGTVKLTLDAGSYTLVWTPLVSLTATNFVTTNGTTVLLFDKSESATNWNGYQLSP